MPTVHAIPVADTVAGTPRRSSNFNYNGNKEVSVNVLLVCPTWASADPAQNVIVDVQQSFDSGTTWESFATMTTQGARLGRTGNMPTMTCQCIDGFGPRIVRIEFRVDTGSLVAGVDVTT